MQAAARESSPRGSGMHGAASRRRAWEARADSVTGATKWQPREGSGRGETRVLAARRSRELPLTWRGPGEGPRTRPTARPPGEDGPRPGSRGCAGCPADWPAATPDSQRRRQKRQVHGRVTRASAGEEGKASGTRTSAERSESTELWLEALPW